ncbi:MAG: chorismate mutase [Promethearchaeota archaeon]
MRKEEFCKKDLDSYRNTIDKIDNKIISLLNKRGKIVQKIGKLKREIHIDLNQPQREKEIIERMKLKSVIFEKVSIENIWREIMEASKLIQNLIVND